MATISFARGVPSADLLPVAELESAIQRAMQKDPAGMLLYGDPMGYLPLREWVGARVVNNLKGHSYSLINKDFELTIGIDRNDIEDDQLGMYAAYSQMLGQQAAKLPDDLLAAVLQNTSDKCFDGKAFFATDHEVAPGDPGLSTDTYSNSFTKALTGPNFNDVYAAMSAYKGMDGDPLGIMPTLLVVPPQLRAAAYEIAKAQLVPSGTAAVSNINFQLVDVLIVPQLANQPTTWYLLDTSKPIKPFLMQTRKAASLVARDNPADPSVFDKKEFLFGVDSRMAAGYTLPFLAAKSVD